MAGQPLDPDEWDSVLGKLIRYHMNVAEELKDLIIKIRTEMKSELVPVAEDKATYGKVIKQGIRAMWSLEYEILDLQKDFVKQLGSIDLENLTDDFVEDALLQSKPLQGVLKEIRRRQKEKMLELLKDYGENLKDLEPMKIPRPPKPEKKPEEPKKPEQAKKIEEPKEESKAPEAEAAAAPQEDAAPPAEAAPAEEAAPPAENAPAPAIDASAVPAAVEASA